MNKILKIEDKYIFLKGKNKIVTPNGNLLKVNKRKHAKLIIKEIENKERLKDPYSVINLTFFSCNLQYDDKEEIKKKILELLKFDLVLYRCFQEEDLIKIMNKKFNSYIRDFGKKFKLKIHLLNSLIDVNKYDETEFKKFLDSFNSFNLTIFFKSASLTKSVILTYFFLMKKINYNSLYKLTNIEYNFQQRKWGVVLEQKESEKIFFEAIKNISFFYKNIN
jgi:chaperone required for assembly of F1-ATPase